MKSRPMILVVGLFMVSPLDRIMGFQVPGPEECLKAMEPVDPLLRVRSSRSSPLKKPGCCRLVDFDTVPAPHPGDGEPLMILRNHELGGIPTRRDSPRE